MRAVGRLVGAAGEIVEGLFRDADDVCLDEVGAFARTVLRMLQRAFPLEHGPAVEVVGRHLGEDRAEIDLAVAERTEAAGALDPALIAAIDALASGRVELGILDVEHLDPVLVDVDVVEIVEALQDEVRRIVEHVGARMVADALQEHLVGDAVMQVFARMDLVADVDAVLVGMVEDRLPAAGKLVEGGLDQTGGALRPRIDEGPGKRAGEGRMRLEAEIASRPSAPA